MNEIAAYRTPISVDATPEQANNLIRNYRRRNSLVGYYAQPLANGNVRLRLLVRPARKRRRNYTPIIAGVVGLAVFVGIGLAAAFTLGAWPIIIAVTLVAAAAGTLFLITGTNRCSGVHCSGCRH